MWDRRVGHVCAAPPGNARVPPGRGRPAACGWSCESRETGAEALVRQCCRGGPLTGVRRAGVLACVGAGRTLAWHSRVCVLVWVWTLACTVRGVCVSVGGTLTCTLKCVCVGALDTQGVCVCGKLTWTLMGVCVWTRSP